MKKELPPRRRVRNITPEHPFLAVISISVLLASMAAVFLLLMYLDMTSTELRDKAAAEQLNAQITALKTRLANEQNVRTKAAAEAKIASDAALTKGIIPEPVSIANDAGGPHMNPSKLDVVINKTHPIIPLAYSPKLVEVQCAGGDTATIHPLAKSDFEALCDAASKANVPLAITSSYRSYATQTSTYNYWVASGGIASADAYSARPGYSEHQTGFAIDFRVPNGASLNQFAGTLQQVWLSENGPNYGFIQRYTDENHEITGYNAESWHYRYVGRSYATQYTTSNVGSLEKFWNIPGGLY